MAFTQPLGRHRDLFVHDTMLVRFATLTFAATANALRPNRWTMAASTGESLPFLVLGSKSATRQQIVREMGFDYRVETPDIDEKAIGDRSGDAEELVLEVGKAKALALLERLTEEAEGTVLLTGDQVVVQGDKILEKPEDLEEARRFIKGYVPGAPCGTVGSCVLTDISTGKQVSGVDKTEIHFNPISDDVVDVLLEEGVVMHCAGGLMIEHPLVQPFIDRIEGDTDSVMGLSSRLTMRLLKDLQSM